MGVLNLELHLREERKIIAAIKMEEYTRRTAGYCNKKVKVRRFDKGDLVLRRTDGGKLDPRWEGPYLVDAEVAPSAYKLKNYK